jgi:alkylation response protein AidB-like acyl-CoA dehydrogenase
VAVSIEEHTTWAGLPDSVLNDIIRDRGIAESQGSVTEDVVAGLAAAGVFRLFTPREYGGYECAPRTVLESTRTLAGLDSSAGWLMMASCNSALLAARMDPTGAREVFADPSAVVAGSLHRGGTAVPVDGGFRFSGTWRLASGAARASWLICSAVVEERDDERPWIFLIEQREARICPGEPLIGLRGSGTDSFSVTDCFVPLRRAIAPGAATRIRRPLYLSPMANFINPPLAAVALGIADRALDAFRRTSATRRSRGSDEPARRSALVQDLFGRALSLRDSGAAYLFTVVDRAWEEALTSPKLSDQTTSDLFLATATTMHNCVEAVRMLYDFGGAQAIVESSELGRCLRDIHTANHHDAASEAIFGRVGDFALNGRGTRTRPAG